MGIGAMTKWNLDLSDGSETFKALGKEVFYLKSTLGKKTPDFLIRDSEDIVFEIGGKGKGRSQFKGVSVKKKISFARLL